MIKSVAILLIAVSAGASPWDTPEAAGQTAAEQAPVGSSWGGDAALADHQYQLDLDARRSTQPLAPTPMNSSRNRSPLRQGQPPARGGVRDPNRDVRLAQFVDDDAWPTAGAAADGRDIRQGGRVRENSSRGAQTARPSYLGTNPGANPTNGTQADAGFVPPAAENRVPATLDDPYQIDRPNPTRRYAPIAPQTNPAAADPRETSHRQIDAMPDDTFDSRHYRPADDSPRDTQQVPPSGTLNDPYAAYGNENSRLRQPAPRPTTQFVQPIGTPRIADTANVDSDAAPPPVFTTSKINTPPMTPAATAATVDPTDPAQTTAAASTLPVAIDQQNNHERGGGTLLLLAFFASVGLNFYLGWIAWDTYNRYQDMVSDIRYSNTSARRERVERDRDLVDRRSSNDRRLVDSGAY